jgi:lysophospholipase L1-like esterase
VFAADVADRLERWCRSLLTGCEQLLVWTVPPLGRGGPRYGSPTSTALNRLLAEELVPALCREGHRVTLADVYTALAPDGTVTPGVLGHDGVHPTPVGYQVIAGVLAPLAVTILGES